VWLGTHSLSPPANEFSLIMQIDDLTGANEAKLREKIAKYNN
jgi:hypothetical protein